MAVVVSYKEEITMFFSVCVLSGAKITAGNGGKDDTSGSGGKREKNSVVCMGEK